jgi:NADH:ubiquinone oxidoreductase subunit 6 (subunit J)
MPVSEILLNVVFYAVAAAAVGGGIAVALSRNIVRSAFALLTVLFGVAAIYALARADFIVAAQILIYVGGILVLIIFAIMLTHKITDVKISNESSPSPVSVMACLCLFVLLVTAFVHGFSWKRDGPPQSREFAVPGRSPVRTELSMWQGGGRTRVVPGGTVLDGFVQVRIRTASDLPSTTRAQFGILKQKKDGTWEEVPPPKPVKFAKEEDGASVAGYDFDRLAEGKYRWRARLDDEMGASPWVEFQDEKSGADFISEKGLTRALGRGFMGPYLLAFEVVSVLLLAALVGAAFLARKEVRE